MASGEQTTSAALLEDRLPSHPPSVIRRKNPKRKEEKIGPGPHVAGKIKWEKGKQKQQKRKPPSLRYISSRQTALCVCVEDNWLVKSPPQVVLPLTFYTQTWRLQSLKSWDFQQLRKSAKRQKAESQIDEKEEEWVCSRRYRYSLKCKQAQQKLCLYKGEESKAKQISCRRFQQQQQPGHSMINELPLMWSSNNEILSLSFSSLPATKAIAAAAVQISTRFKLAQFTDIWNANPRQSSQESQCFSVCLR